MRIQLRRDKANIEAQLDLGSDDFPLFSMARRGLDLGALDKDSGNTNLYIRAQASLFVAQAMRDWHKAMVDAVAEQLMERVRVDLWREPPSLPPGDDERSEGAIIGEALSTLLHGALLPPTLGGQRDDGKGEGE